MSRGKLFGRTLVFTFVGAVVGSGLAIAAANPTDATGQQTRPAASSDERMAWWREAKFGMFIHWGLYAIPAGEWQGKRIEGIGEWIMNTAQIPVQQYEPLAKQFNPVKFNAADWVSIAKEAGIKYIVITSKHHDGFCLFDSKLTDYDIMDATPFKRDVPKELAQECHRQGIKICWYHSILDWHHPDYLPRRKWDTRPTEGASYDRYIDYMKGQLRELLTNYGEIGVLWFDGGWEHTAQEHRSEEVVAMIRGLQPNIIINDRSRIPQDFDTPEQTIPPTGIPGRDWETCMTMNDTWGYKSYDNNWKSTEDLIHKLVDIVSKGGNFLLNVGPTAEGLIPQASVERLAAMGKWLQVNGDSIYGTQASPFRSLPFEGRCTRKADKLYLHIFRWVPGPVVLQGLRMSVVSVHFLADQTQLKHSQQDDKLTFYLPAEAPDKIDSVVVLQCSGPVSVDTTIRQAADGSITFLARDAEVHGRTAQFERRYDQLGNIGHWTDPNDWVSWQFIVTRPGSYEVVVTQACPADIAGSRYAIQAGNVRLEATVRQTDHWGDFQTVDAGAVPLSAGVNTLTVRPVNLAGNAVMNLQKVQLKPAATAATAEK
jgi:alpha-L-fucosidase